MEKNAQKILIQPSCSHGDQIPHELVFFIQVKEVEWGWHSITLVAGDLHH
ncbi:MAG: hypothetical protein HOK41_06850 [Nitrospina sp.]|nr:hypothetical protein [Nitrospina sp.]